MFFFIVHEIYFLLNHLMEYIFLSVMKYIFLSVICFMKYFFCIHVIKIQHLYFCTITICYRSSSFTFVPHCHYVCISDGANVYFHYSRMRMRMRIFIFKYSRMRIFMLNMRMRMRMRYFT